MQVNLDFSSESDMVAKLRASLALQPIVSALFSNSVLRHGRESGFHGWRSNVYLHVDESRCGSLPFVFSPDFAIESYVDWVLDAPMVVTARAGAYFNCKGGSFRDFIVGRLPALPGALPTLCTSSYMHKTCMLTSPSTARWMQSQVVLSIIARRPGVNVSVTVSTEHVCQVHASQ